MSTRINRTALNLARKVGLKKLSPHAIHIGPQFVMKARIDPRNQAELADFLTIQFPPSEPFIEGLLNRREFVTLLGRRRHGKTTILLNFALSLTGGKPGVWGYRIPKPLRVLAFFLEDDPSELQAKLKAMIGNGPVPRGFHIFTKEGFRKKDKRIPINVQKSEFKNFVTEKCREAKPDLIIFDNLSHLVRGDFNNSTLGDEVVNFVYDLQDDFNAAVIIAAHPRKRSNQQKGPAIDLESDPEAFFEECMGTSHIINSAGTLWGIERQRRKERTVFVGGTQRRDGSQGITPLEMREGWFFVLDDFQERLESALNTEKRIAAWDALPSDRLFTRKEAEEVVKDHLTRTPFLTWWNELVRLELVIAMKDDQFQKRNVLGTGSTLADRMS